jgi:hypothetical protein
LLSPGGAADLKPRLFRLRLDLLEFASPEERSTSDRVWTSQPLLQYTIQGELQPQQR